LKVVCSSKYLPIFLEGFFYPQLIIGNKENSKILSIDELNKMTSEEQVFYNMSKNALLNISNLEELRFLKTSPKIKRFRFWSFRPGFANPQVYYFELTNEAANEKTSFENFIKNSNLTFIKSGHIVI